MEHTKETYLQKIQNPTLLLRLMSDYVSAVDKRDFKESQDILDIMNYIWGASEDKVYNHIYSLLLIYRSWVYSCFENSVSEKSSLVYFIRDKNSNLIKIGCTTNLDERLSQLKRRYETDYEVLFTLHIGDNTVYQAENFFHRLYKQYRRKGEFFELPQKEVEKLQNLVADGKGYNQIKDIILGA